jgi:hypothetical protein
MPVQPPIREGFGRQPLSAFQKPENLDQGALLHVIAHELDLVRMKR